MFDLFGIYRRKFIQGLQAETPEELFGRPEQKRSPGGIKTAVLLDQSVFDQLINRMIRFDPSDLLYPVLSQAVCKR